MSEEQDSWLQGLGINVDQVLQVKQDAEASVQSSLQSAQNSVFESLGVSAETAQTIRDGEQAIADFQKGREAGRAEGSLGLINMLPPVQLVKAVSRIADADDPEAEAIKIAEEKAATAAAIGRFGTDPIGAGSDLGENFAKKTLQAKKEGRLAEFGGNIAGHADLIAATVAVGGAAAGAEAGAARGAAAGAEAGAARGVGVGVEAGAARGVGAGVEAGGARGVAAGVEAGAEGEAGVLIRTAEGADAAAPTVRAPAFGEPIPPTEFPATEFPPTEPGIPPTLRSPTSPLGEPISPLAESVRPPNVGDPFPLEGPPTELPPPAEPIPPTLRSPEPVSPLAESVPTPRVGEPIPDTIPSPGPEPFEPAPSFELPPDTVPSPGPEPFSPAPSFELPPETVPTFPEPFNPAPSFEIPPDTIPSLPDLESLNPF